MKHGIKGVEEVWATFATAQRHGCHLFFHARRDEQFASVKDRFQILNKAVLRLLAEVNKTV